MLILTNPRRACRQLVSAVDRAELTWRSRDYESCTSAGAGVRSPPPSSANLGHPSARALLKMSGGRAVLFAHQQSRPARYALGDNTVSAVMTGKITRYQKALLAERRHPADLMPDNVLYLAQR